MAVSIVNDEQFLSEISVYNKIMVKYFTDWCGSCRMLRPKYIRLSEDPRFNNIRFLDINAEYNPVARKLANVTHFPTFAIFNNGQLIKSVATAKEDLVIELIIKLINL
jgi:thioredoxin 1